MIFSDVRAITQDEKFTTNKVEKRKKDKKKEGKGWNLYNGSNPHKW